MEYLKYFDEHNEYETYINGEVILFPNVSYCDDDDEVHFNNTETRMVATYDAGENGGNVMIYQYYDEAGHESDWTRGIDSFSKIVIDGVDVSVVDLDTAQGIYQMTSGIHTVRYTFLPGVNLILDYFWADEYEGEGVSNLKTMYIPDGITSIEEYAFSDSSIESIWISDSVTTIGRYCFDGCEGLTSVHLPANLTEITVRCFQNCSGLENITIPENVTDISGYAFRLCSSLTSITLLATTPPALMGTSFYNTPANKKFYVPAASVDAYKAATNWSSFASSIEAIPS